MFYCEIFNTYILLAVVTLTARHLKKLFPFLNGKGRLDTVLESAFMVP